MGTDKTGTWSFGESVLWYSPTSGLDAIWSLGDSFILDADITWALLANIQGASLTSDITGIIARGLLANVIAGSLTPDVAANLARTLSALVTAQSTTADILGNVARGLSAVVAAQSVTANIQTTVVRMLLADIRGSSLTPDDLFLYLIVLGIIVDPTIESVSPRRTIHRANA